MKSKIDSSITVSLPHYLKSSIASCCTAFLFLLIIVSCKQGKKFHDEVVVNTEVSSAALKSILDFQKDKNKEFEDPETSPLPDRFRKNFEGLDFYTPDTTFVVEALLNRTPESPLFAMPNSTGGTSTERVFGKIKFYLKGAVYELEVYQSPDLMMKAGYEDYLFLPFTDLTNGETTYGGGRYLDLQIPEGDTLIIDFNRAYNPYCAYNKKYSCPLVPRQNRMKTKIKAGVKAFKAN